MSDQRGKLGDNFVIRVPSKTKVTVAQEAPGRRKGPYPVDEEEIRPVERPQTVYLLDGTHSVYKASREVNAVWYLPEDLTGFDVGDSLNSPDVAPSSRYNGFLITGNEYHEPTTAPEGNPFKWDVKNPLTGEIFKRIFYLPCLNKSSSDVFELSVKLGSKEIPITSTSPDFKAGLTPEERLVIVEAQIAQGSTPELVLKRDNILLEIEELLTADNTEKLRWDNDYRDFAVPEGYVKSIASGKTWEVKTTGIFYEPFNPFDTVNYKVVVLDDPFFPEGNPFTDEEVAAPKLNGRDALYIVLKPQNWQSTFVLNIWTITGQDSDLFTLDVQKLHRTYIQYVNALVLPQPAFVQSAISQAESAYPGPVSPFDSSIATETIYWRVGGFDSLSAPIPSGLVYGPDSTPERSAVGILGTFGISGVGLNDSCTNKVEQGNSHVEKLCGSFRFKDKYYNVYRKTERVAIDPVVLYDGIFDGPGSPEGGVVTSSSLGINWFEDSPDFAGYTVTLTDIGSDVVDLRP